MSSATTPSEISIARRKQIRENSRTLSAGWNSGPSKLRAHLKKSRIRFGWNYPIVTCGPEIGFRRSVRLAQQFGVSRNTLREALRSLENAGLLRLQKGASGGAFVRESTGDAIITGLRDMFHLGAIQPEHLTEARVDRIDRGARRV